jgi:hypothetical protein
LTNSYHCRHFAAIGAFLTVSSLALETAVGSAIYISVKGPALPNNTDISTPRTNQYTFSLLGTSGTALGDQAPLPAMMAAIDSGLSEGIGFGDVAEASVALITPKCDTDYCYFGYYQSLGVNYICEDLSDQIVATGNSYYLPSNSALGNPLSLDKVYGFVNSTVSYQYPDSSVFMKANDVGPLIANIFIVTNSYANADPVAVECVLYWSVFTYYSLTNSDGWTENITETTTNLTSVAKEAAINPKLNVDIIIEPQDCWINDTLYEDHYAVVDVDGNPECISFVSPSAQLGLQNWMANTKYGFPGSFTWAAGPNGDSYSYTNPFMGYLSQLLLEGNSTIAAQYIGKYIFENLASSMTTTIRFLPRRNILFSEGGYVMWSQGIMYDTWRFHVRWWLMAFPVLLVIGCITFSFTIAVTAREHLWKKSTLPLLFHGLGPREMEAVGEIEDYVGMEEKAISMQVKFSNTAQGQLRLLQMGHWEAVKC